MPGFLLQFLTGLFLVFAGILIGYFLWFRDRTKEEQLQQSLTNENDRLATELSSMRQRTSELEAQSSRQHDKLQILQELCDDLASGREESIQQQLEISAELQVSRELLDESREKLNKEHVCRAELEDRLHALQQRHLETVGSLEGHWREKHAKIESALSHRENEVQQLTSINDRIASNLHQAEARIAELQSEIQSHCSMLETAKKNASGLEKEYVTLESSLRSQIESLNESRGQVAAAISAKTFAEESLRELRSQFDGQQQKLEALERVAAEAEHLDQKCASLQQSLANNQNRMVEITGQRDAARSAEKDALSAISGLRKQNENQEATIRKLRGEQETLNKSVKQESTARTILENELIDQRRQWSQTEENFARRISKLEDALKQNQNELADKTNELANTANELALAVNELVKTEMDLNQSEERVIELERQLGELESRSAEFTSRAEHLVQQRDNALSDKQALLSELDRLKMHSKANEETIRNLRRERGAVLLRNREARAEQPRIISGIFGTANRKSVASSEEHFPGVTHRDPLRGVIYIQPPAIKDDLKLISGIAEVLERQLNDCGIYTYQQIMEWDQTAINEFSKLVTFKARIERDDWVGQARRLYQRRYRQAA